MKEFRRRGIPNHDSRPETVRFSSCTCLASAQMTSQNVVLCSVYAGHYEFRLQCFTGHSGHYLSLFHCIVDLTILIGQEVLFSPPPTAALTVV